MAKVLVYKFWLRCILLSWLLVQTSYVRAQYQLKIHPVDADSAYVQEKLGIQTSFRNRVLCMNYVNRLSQQLQLKGYPAASVDSIGYDSVHADLFLYVGSYYQWTYLRTDSIDPKILDAVNWNRKNLAGQPVNFQEISGMQQKMLDYLENNGYPFASVLLDSIQMGEDRVSARLKIETGPLYKIDSVRNQGNARITRNFLHHYLSILPGSIYRKDKLQNISKRFTELQFLEEQQPWDLTLLGTGSILNVYLKPRRSSQVNVLLGFLPATQSANNIYETPRTKLLFTGEATINLRNALGSGESIGLNWQQIQQKSPRLNIAYQQPYIFSSPFGVNFAFDLFKKDSSFVNINTTLGVQYAVSASQNGSVFIQNFRSNLLTVDTFSVKINRQLPLEADVSSINFGISLEGYRTNYRYNPRKGNEWQFIGSVGTKNIRKNNVIVQLKDPNDPGYDFNSLYDTVKLKSYQVRLKFYGAHYFPLTRASTLKTAMHIGWFESPSIFRNELFQIGGYRLLRGFDEESIYASRYLVTTVEYRYLIGINSYFFSFVDGGWIRNNANNLNLKNSFFGAGIGLAFETKAGIFNISYAAGKRNDLDFSLRQSKIHLGFVSYF